MGSAELPAKVAKATRQYLERHAEPEAQLGAQLATRRAHGLAVPLCAEEPPGVFALLDSCARQSVAKLVVLVVNGSEAHDEAVHRKNAELITALRERYGRSLEGAPGETRLLLVDRAGDGRRLPARQGVGLARKIGLDVLCAAHAHGALANRWLHTTDADARLPPGYFDASASRTDPGLVALCYPFVHERSGDAAVDEAHVLYELYLRYHLLGLRWAGSRYAFHTIGSTLAIDAGAYARVRGVPRKQAGEDFYLLAKAAKLGRVASAPGAPVTIAARRSRRVPFGTGPATAAIAAQLQRGEAYTLLHPACFSLLRHWLGALEAYAAGGQWRDAEAQLTDLSTGDRQLLLESLGDIGTRAALDASCRDLRSAAQRQRRCHEWFDALRTRQLLHALRDRRLGSLPWGQALEHAPFAPIGEPHSAAEAWLERLVQAEQRAGQAPASG
jgi:hypothetical protein